MGVVRLRCELALLSLLLACASPAAELNVPEAAFSQPRIPDWKEEIARGYVPYHQLTAEDFAVNDTIHPDASFWLEPFTQYYYHYMLKMARGGMVYAYVMDWTVFSGVDRNLTSRKSKFHEVGTELPYAQAILDLNELYARALGRLEPGQLPSGSGKDSEEARQQLELRLREFCEAQMNELRKEGNAFIAATDHGQNRKKLHELSAEIKQRLAALDPPSSRSPGAGSPPGTTSPSASATVGQKSKHKSKSKP